MLSPTTIARTQRLAQARAVNEHTRGNSAADDPWQLRNARELHESLTGEKYPNTDDLIDFMEHYETAYYAQFEDLENDND